jgi:hypothetical protein
MDASRSYYLNSKHDDFAELDPEKCRLDTTNIPYVIPANDNAPTKVRLSARCGALLRRLIAMHSLNRTAPPKN